MPVSDADLAAFFAAFRERAKGYGRPGPRPVYDPGAAPSLPKPTTDAVPPQSHHDVDQDEEGD